MKLHIILISICFLLLPGCGKKHPTALPPSSEKKGAIVIFAADRSWDQINTSARRLFNSAATKMRPIDYVFIIGKSQPNSDSTWFIDTDAPWRKYFYSISDSEAIAQLTSVFRDTVWLNANVQRLALSEEASGAIADTIDGFNRHGTFTEMEYLPSNQAKKK